MRGPGRAGPTATLPAFRISRLAPAACRFSTAHRGRTRDIASGTRSLPSVWTRKIAGSASTTDASGRAVSRITGRWGASGLPARTDRTRRRLPLAVVSIALAFALPVPVLPVSHPLSLPTRPWRSTSPAAPARGPLDPARRVRPDSGRGPRPRPAPRIRGRGVPLQAAPERSRQ